MFVPPINARRFLLLIVLMIVPQVAIGLQTILGLADKERDEVVASLTDVLERSRRL